MDKATSSDAVAVSQGGTARLPVTITVAFISFLAQALLHYLLPLYFPAKGLPKAAWETWSLYEIIAWLFTPPIAGLLAARFGEKLCWAAGLTGYATVGLCVALLPTLSPWTDTIFACTGVLWGFASAMIWVGGISLVQKVPEHRRGLSNALMMTALGAGSIAGPLIGRLLVHWLAGDGVPVPGDFGPALAAFAALSLLGAGLIFILGEYRFPGEGVRLGSRSSSSKTGALQESLALLRYPKYIVLVIALSLLGGPVFQATNVYRPYRARDPQIGLIVGAQDHGWAALEVTGYVMQLLGGLLVGFLAGKKASGWTAALLLGCFSLFGLGIGLAPNAVMLFAFSALFEIARQFMRWVQTGYVSEYVSEQQRAPAIGFSVTLSGIGSWAFNVLTRALQSPDSPNFSSALPFVIAAGLGLLGTAILIAAQFGPQRPAQKASEASV